MDAHMKRMPEISISSRWMECTLALASTLVDWLWIKWCPTLVHLQMDWLNVTAVEQELLKLSVLGVQRMLHHLKMWLNLKITSRSKVQSLNYPKSIPVTNACNKTYLLRLRGVAWRRPSYIERIAPDLSKLQPALQKAKQFCKLCILPELAGKRYSYATSYHYSNMMLMKKMVVHGASVKKQKAVMWLDVTIKDVPLKWFHLSCLNMDTVPSGKWGKGSKLFLYWRTSLKQVAQHFHTHFLEHSRF